VRASTEILSLHHFGFISPRYLFVLLAVPLLFVFVLIIRRRRSPYTVAFSNLDVFDGLIRELPTRWWRGGPLILLALVLATSALALARPRIQLNGSEQSTTIVLLVDVSGSMAATDVRPDRIKAAVTAMRDFLDELPKNDKVGLVTFSDKVTVIDAPTTDFAAVNGGLNLLSPEGGTALGVGVEGAVRIVVSSLAAAGVHRIGGAYLPAAIVLESDGSQDRGNVTPFAAAELAKDVGIRVYGVALGKPNAYIVQSSGFQRVKIAVPPDPGTVALLARVSGGQSFSAANATRLDTVYRSLGLGIGHHPELTEITPWFEIAAGILLACAVGGILVRGAALP